MSKALIKKIPLAETIIVVSQNDGGLFPPNLTIHAILEAEARAFLVDAMLFTREAAAILKKASNNFINQLKCQKL